MQPTLEDRVVLLKKVQLVKNLTLEPAEAPTLENRAVLLVKDPTLEQVKTPILEYRVVL